LGFGILTAFGIVTYFIATPLVSFFVPEDKAVIAGGALFLKTMCLAWGFMGVQLCLTGILRASGNMVTALVLTLVSQWVLQFPLAFILSRHTGLGVRGLWIAFPVSNIIIALITMAVYAKGDWKHKRLTGEPDQLTRKVTEEIISDEGIHA
jgi:Na+-driven multidrug efflux pump